MWEGGLGEVNVDALHKYFVSLHTGQSTNIPYRRMILDGRLIKLYTQISLTENTVIPAIGERGGYNDGLVC